MTSHPLRDRRVLVVEDEYYLAMDLKRDLTAGDATVLGPVPSIDLAMALTASEPDIDVAVLDINLGGEMSYPVADALMARGIPFVFMTGYSDGIQSARYAGIALCEKPLEFHRLEAALVAALGAS